jgi:glycosyltransferase involved in cell wall biosynthesis
MITQRLDPADPMLGFVVGWVKALAARTERLDVLTLDAAKAQLPANVYAQSMGKGQVGKAQMAANFYKALLAVAPHADAVLAHMVPRYLWMSAPVTIPRRKPLALWYTHKQVSAELRLALALASHVFTTTPDSFPLASPKVRALGHGVDAGFFTPASIADPATPPLIVQVGRLMPIKAQHTLIEALAQLQSMPWQAAFVGSVPAGQSNAYANFLKEEVARHKLGQRITFTGGLPPAGVRDMYRRASIAVNLSPVGLFDKAVLEGMMVGVPSIVSNAAFAPLFGNFAADHTLRDSDDVAGLTAKLRRLLGSDAGWRQTVGASQRDAAIAAHSLSPMIDRLLAALAKA